MIKKSLLFLLLFLLIPISVNAALVGPDDTLSIPFWNADSAGVKIDLVAGDSVYLVVFSPGNTVVFKDSMAANDASIAYYDFEDFSKGRSYRYSELVGNLLGSATSRGIYTYDLTAHDIDLGLTTMFRGEFQYISHSLDTILAYLDATISSRGTSDFDYTTNNVIISNGYLTTAKFATGFLTGTLIGSGALDGKGNWNIGKTGYSLTQTFPTNFSALAITGGGAVTAGTVSDKAGYSISGSKTTLDALNDFNYASQKVTIADTSAGDISLLANNHPAVAVSGTVALADNGLTAAKLATDAVNEIEAAVYANRADYQADLSGVLAAIDTLGYNMTVVPGSKSATHYYLTIDTIFVYHPGGVLNGRLLLWHLGASEMGAAPDSITVENVP